MQIKPMTDAHQEQVRTLAVEAGLFGPSDWSEPNLTELQPEHTWLVIEDESGTVLGATYFGPEQVSFSLWNIFFLAIRPENHGQGLGKMLMEYIQSSAVASGIQTLIVETSGTDSYSGARNFYQTIGYVAEAVIRDYYGPGDNKIVFWKTLKNQPHMA